MRHYGEQQNQPDYEDIALVLAELWGDTHVSNAAVAKRLLFTPQRARDTLIEMEEQGYVEFQFGPGWTLTPAGYAAFGMDGEV